MNEPKKCGCGRSPSGMCIGWHKLTEEEYQKAFLEHIERAKKLEEEKNDRKT